ncbi:hypothetical protein AMATHDRAFT_70915 [Amanita thiersii Skay4041]|uniref:Zn(2)-C6 fungal-type domain-containing protein n=1 Tax=Amanita thiersii Skay4041 TaxID=703135 RepID=A0A2A9NDV6_9AGAR|nr:hypothetical protein AMATHDRAFT_70915 [Amanita thiersii Skay4041]
MPSTPSSFHSYRDDSSPVSTSRTRRRGMALSCAECRRLKLKCSRDFPCNNCVKKGCGAICPSGSLTTGKGNRFVLANTEALHEKINELANRVRQLEDALRESHSLNSSESHPLLCEELLQIKRPLERERIDQHPTVEEKLDAADAIDALGSLSISHGGRSNFFGTTANSWYLLKNEQGSEGEDESPNPESNMSSDDPLLQHAFPFASISSESADSVRSTIRNYLPRLVIAKKLCEIYFRHAAWMYTPISEGDFYDTIFNPIYEESDTALRDTNISHMYAVLYMVLALGALLNLELPPHNLESMHLFKLGRAALTIDSVLEEQSQTIAGLQALVLMCHFMFLAEMGGPRWVVMGMVVKLAHSIGLHRDTGKWNLNEEETQRRRELFYELVTYDSWQSLTFGRPPSFSPAHIDCKLPFETTENDKGESEMSFRAWKHQFSAQCLSRVHDEAFGARTPSYKLIQELDKKVRNWYIPPSLQVPGFGGVRPASDLEQPSVEFTMQRYIAFAIKEITLFYMHRGFFAQALEDNPTDPMGSKYAESVLAAYRSACSFVGLIEDLFNQHHGLTERMWFLFTHVFSCAIVLGAIAVKPRMAIAPSALSHLDCAYNLFLRVSDNTRKAKILPILHKLRERAHCALMDIKQLPPETNARTSLHSTGIKSEVDEFSALGGMTRLVSRRSPSSPSSHAGSASPISQPASPPVMQQLVTYQQLPQQLQSDIQHSWQSFPPNAMQGFSTYPQQTFYATSPPQQDIQLGYNGAHQHVVQYDSMHEYYSYSPGGGDYNGSVQVVQPADNGAPAQDPAASWHNFIAPYKYTS